MKVYRHVQIQDNDNNKNVEYQNDSMGHLSRQSSRAPVSIDDASSFTSFPDPDVSTAAEGSNDEPLQRLLDKHGASMFDENTTVDANDAQSLSVASESVLRDVIDHHGSVELVKRLSKMLAERDAHITALKRLAEEYKIPRHRIVETTSRARQAEERRMALAAAAEDSGIASGVESESQASKAAQDVLAPVRGFTKLFGGTGKAKAPSVPVTTTQDIFRPRRASGRPRSIDVQSIRSTESVGWTASINNIFASSNPKRTRADSDARLPVEMETRHDKDQLPPTLSNQTEDPQEAEWNKFIQRLLELRQQDYEELNGGELIGASQFGKEGNAGRAKMDTLTRLVVGGIPMKLRHPLWLELSNTQAMIQPDTYECYLNLSRNDDPEEIEAIVKDVPRTLTSKYDFYAGKGYQRLKDLLLAFVAKYPSLGYTQGLNTIAGYILLAIPSSSDAFWLLCHIVENLFPPDYFSRTDAMISPLADNSLIRQYVKELMPQLDRHLQKLGIQPGHTVPIKWFFTAFSSALPEKVLLRVWDVWLCLPSQKQFLFPFALSLLVDNAEKIMECEDASSFFAYMDGKLKVPEDPAQLTELIKQAYKLGKRLGDDIAERRREEVEKTKASMRLERRLERRRTGSLEVLVDRDEVS